jgi:hypothetical protein
MEMVRKVMDLPISGSGCLWARFAYDDTDGTVEFHYTDNQTRQSCIGILFFPHVMSFRFRDEPHIPVDFPSESYESVAEVSDSPWLAELERTEPKSSYSKLWGRRHFVVLLTNCGFFELIADDCEFSTRKTNEQYGSGKSGK